MEVRYPIKVLYTLGASQLMLARAEPTDCRPVKPRPNATTADKHASTTLKECLGALCGASPELLADPRTDYSVYALDPLQTPELMVGRGLLTWLLAESGRVVGTVREDYVDGEEMQVLEIRLSLTPTVAVSKAQHASSLQNISHPVAPTTSTHLSPPSTPSGQPQASRSSVRIRIKTTARAQEKAATAAAAPPASKKRGPRKGSSNAPTTPQTTLLPEPASPDPTPGPSNLSPPQSRVHSRVSSASSLPLSQNPSQPKSRPRPPTSFGSNSTSASSTQPSQSSQTPAHSPGKSLARMLLAASASSSSSSYSSAAGTPLFDSLVERLKTAGLLGQAGADPSTPTDAQKQAIISFIGRTSESDSDRNGRLREGGGSKGNERVADQGNVSAPSPSLTSIQNPPASGSAQSPSVISAPSPAILTAPSPGAFATPIPPPDSNLGTRKREPEDQPSLTDPKRARLGVGLGEARTSSLASLDSHLSKGLKLEDDGHVSLSDISPNSSVPSPAFSATSPNFAAPSPSLSVLSAPSPNLSVASPSISAASPFALPYSSSAPLPPSLPLDASASQPEARPSSQSLTHPAPPSQPQSQTNNPLRSISQPNLFSSSSNPPKPRKRTPRQTPLHQQTDLPEVRGSFITPREQIGLPRAPAPPSPAKCVAGPGRSKGGNANGKDTGIQLNPESGKRPEQGQEKDRAVRGVSEEEVRVMLADGYYPPSGLGVGHRKLFGAKNVPRVEGEDVDSDVLPVGSTSSSTAPRANNRSHKTNSSSKYYRAPDYEPPPRTQTQKSNNAGSKKAPPIPKRSPVALPLVRRLPMMMTSPIRATGGRVSDPEDDKGKKGKSQKGKTTRPAPEPVPAPAVEQPAKQLPLSLTEYSPLRRLLRNAGLDNLKDVLGQAGVLGLKDDVRWTNDMTGRAGAKAAMIKEQEREIVDLTSDADEEDESVPVKAPVLVSKAGTSKPREPQTPTRGSGAPATPPPLPQRTPRTVQHRASAKLATPPRPSRTSPVAPVDSPLFAPTPPPTTGGAYTQNISSEGLSIPLDLPPSSPPPMSESDLDAGSGAEGDQKDAYREASKYTDAESSEAGLDPGIGDLDVSDFEQQFYLGAGDDEAEDEWNQTIRPAEPAGQDDAAPVGNILHDGALGATSESGLDLDTLASFLNMLDGQFDSDAEAGLQQLGAELDAVLGQEPLLVPTGDMQDPAMLDFSWLDTLGGSEAGESLVEGGVGVNVGDAGGELGEQDISEILAALAAAPADA